MLAKQAGGRFVLRIDDTDPERSREEYAVAIREDLAWLGIDPEGEERQSDHLEQYEAAFTGLRESGRVYRCYETAQDLDVKRKILLSRGKPPIYDRTEALELSEEQHAAKLAEGVSPHWRFKLDHAEPIAWDDGVRGPQKFNAATLSDPVIRRADGSWLYMLPSAVDDISMGITDVLRGEDHVSNTAVQIQMFTAMNATPPRFAHEALLVGKEGKLSKRLGSLGCDQLRDDGIEPEALIAMLSRLGTSLSVEPIRERAALTETFDLSTFGRAPAKFDEAELLRVNTAMVHDLSFAEVAERLPEGITDAGWMAIRPNLERVGDAAEWWTIVTGPINQPEFDAETAEFLQTAETLLEWGDDPWRALTSALKEATGRKGKLLFLPLRQSLTGVNHGPDMGSILPLIGEDAARERLSRPAKSV